MPSHDKKLLPLFWLSLSSFLLLALYRFTAPPGTTPEDASEFILTAHFLGLPHPPGYPLFVWLGHFLTWLPLGTPAQQVAFLSHLSIALTAGLLGYWTLIQTKRLALGVWVTLTYGLSTFSWSSAQFVEVYPLHTFLMTLTFFLFHQLSTISDLKPHLSLVFFSGLVLGLSLSNHYPLVVLTFPALAFFVFSNREVLLSRSVFIRMGMGLVVGILPYTYLFFADHFSEYIFSSPIRTLPDFFEYVLRKEYAQNDRSKAFSLFEFFQYAGEGFKMMITAFTPVVFLSSVLFVADSIRNKLNLNRLIPLSLGVSSSFFLLFLFWQPDYYLLAIELYQSFHGFALGCLLMLSLGPIEQLLTRPRLKKAVSVGLFSIPLVLLVSNFKPNDRRSDTFTSDYADIIFQSLPQKSVLLVKGDADAGVLAYYHFLEKRRPDIKLTSQVAALLPNKLFDRKFDIQKNNHQVALLNFISANLSVQKPVFSIGPVEYFSPTRTPFPLLTKDYGLFREIFEDEPAPKRDVSIATQKEIVFLDNVLKAPYEPNFVHYRDRLIGHVCHSLLISGVDHPAFKIIPRCQILKAQWLHVEKKDYQSADSLFLLGLEGLKNRQNSEVSDLAKDFFLNRMKIISLLSDSEKEERQRLVRETVDITLPLALNFPVCKSNLAKKVYDLSVKAGFVQEAQELRTTFSHCPIEAVPTPD